MTSHSEKLGVVLVFNECHRHIINTIIRNFSKDDNGQDIVRREDLLLKL